MNGGFTLVFAISSKSYYMSPAKTMKLFAPAIQNAVIQLHKTFLQAYDQNFYKRIHICVFKVKILQ